MKLLAIQDMLGDLVCSACRSPTLVYGNACDKSGVVCTACGYRFPCNDGIPDFLLREKLDQTNLEEIGGNDLTNPDALERMMRNDRRGPIYLHSFASALQIVRGFIGGSSMDLTLVSLGSGSGRELKNLCSRQRFRRVYSSDISLSHTSLVPTTLADIDGDLGLFNAEFSNVPVPKRNDTIGLVFQALHHSADPHKAVGALLQHSFSKLIAVEPTTNWLVEALAYFGLAKRVEYSGLQPNWISLGRMRDVARRHGYHMKVRTWWEPPPELENVFDGSRILGRFVSRLIDLVSWATNWFSFGSMSCIYFSDHKSNGGIASKRREN